MIHYTVGQSFAQLELCPNKISRDDGTFLKYEVAFSELTLVTNAP